MILSDGEKVRMAMRSCANSERKVRCIEEDGNSNFLNWREVQGESGTAALVATTRETCRKMNLRLNITVEGMYLGKDESELKTRSAAGIGRFLTQKIIRSEKYEKLIQHEVHGARFTTLKQNEVSNAMLTNIYTRRSDAFFGLLLLDKHTCCQHQ
jgi:hypothetical protein